MLRKTAPLLLASVILLVGCAGRPGNVDPALMSLVPGDTTRLIGMRLDALRTTPFYKSQVATGKLPLEKDMIPQINLHTRDMWEVLVASDGKRTAMLARGKFSADGAEPRIDGTRTSYKGLTMIESGGFAVTFVNASVAVAGPPDAVRAVIDQRDKGYGLPRAIEDQLKLVPKESQVWVVATGNFSGAGDDVAGMISPNAARALSMTENLVAAADLRSGLNAFASLNCRSDQDAASLADAMRGLIAFAKLGMGNDKPDARRALESVKIEQKQRAVRVDVTIPQSDLDKLTAEKVR